MRQQAAVRMATVWTMTGLVLAACGGGGGGGGAPGGPGAMLAGQVSYDYVPNGAQGALDYNAISSKPVRGALVEVVDSASSAVLASGATNEQGRYEIQVPASSPVSVRVRAQMQRSGPDGSWDVSVRDNTQGDAIYAMESPVFAAGLAGGTRDLHAPSGWGGSRYSGARVAAPFAVLDTVYQAMAKVRSVAPKTAFPPLNLYWSTENIAVSGSVALGQIGTTSFAMGGGAGPRIFVLGKENSDTDEYDASVIAHEWGHYYQNAFSRDDSPGGPHAFNDRLDRRLAFSEGWGNAWSGMALERSHYFDSVGPGQGRGTDLDLAAGSASPGWYREDSVQSILWGLYDRHGFGPFHQTLTGPLRTTPAVTSIHAFAAAYGAVLPAARADLSAALVSQSISGVTDDPWGQQESNSGGLTGVLPLYKPVGIGVPTVACVSNAAGNYNKLGSFVYLRANVQAARNYQITVTGPGNADPDFTVYSGARLAASEGPGSSESAAVSLPMGEVVVALTDANDSSSNTCFNVTIQ